MCLFRALSDADMYTTELAHAEAYMNEEPEEGDAERYRSAIRREALRQAEGNERLMELLGGSDEQA